MSQQQPPCPNFYSFVDLILGYGLCGLQPPYDIIISLNYHPVPLSQKEAEATLWVKILAQEATEPLT